MPNSTGQRIIEDPEGTGGFSAPDPIIIVIGPFTDICPCARHFAVTNTEQRRQAPEPGFPQAIISPRGLSATEHQALPNEPPLACCTTRFPKVETTGDWLSTPHTGVDER